MTRTVAAPILAAAGLLRLSLSLAAQNVPARPPLHGADTNQAAAYYQYGLSMLAQDPFKAADAFYWAARIDPSWAQPLYAGRIAYLMGADDRVVIGYMDGNRSFTRSKDARRIDSLELRARMLDPFMPRDPDKDLSYYPAHMRLGTIALSTGDTATALSEMDLAAQINNDEPVLQATYGTILAQSGHIPEAQQHLHRAVELDPFYANSYYVLGRVDEFTGKSSEAAGDYRAYLGHTRAQDPRIADVQRRLAALTGTATNQ